MPDLIAWERRGMILVAPGTSTTPPTPTYDVSELIACPTCHARVVERCKSATGTPRSPHVNRLVPRRCPCGESLDDRKQFCEWCRREARQETYARRERRAPTRKRRRAA
ncbi:hypothetical protein F9L07_22755 [Pimelobacter simplex]|uniref:Uncharacterized protein n=1 Tax=Nocardioides simplex TaxID=2045 RepID=A0A7J5DT70_NOCSI|nr:hypothetical protein [Pimelobacter simplex]KAB2808339.1 hypothetical protein F9L07_22755 [Pimelobacter simplex]